MTSSGWDIWRDELHRLEEREVDIGYQTEFEGQFTVVPPLTPAHRDYLTQFAGTRRMMFDATLVAKEPDPCREAVGLPVGVDGCYFTGEDGFRGQGVNLGGKDPRIKGYNSPPRGQPGLRCQWVPNEDGTAIQWDGGEKFYEYVEWIEYLLASFLIPWGYSLAGIVEWQGEDSGDRGRIIIDSPTGNVTVQHVVITWA